MAHNKLKSTPAHTNNDDESDYGSDFSPEDILLLERLLIQANSEFAPPLAIVDADDEQGHGHFAYIPRPNPTYNQDAANEKEVSSQHDYIPAEQSIKKLVSATLSSPPLLEPTSLFGNEFPADEFDDDKLDSWEVWKDTRKFNYRVN